ncbi:nuclear pore complex protein NUP62-like [Colossoma macropomum]|uniref:nuclear pore complex protein NUP62-like n=1 Tax=Colossoma macropomum TaxID=42526 RepID=UPI001864246E|nr:nuclear pore complex protein NUP62-like [Colossoma macropomum]
MGTGSRVVFYPSSFKPSTSTSKPVQSNNQQVASAQPVWSSSPPSFVSPSVGFDSSAVGSSGSRAFSYTTSFKPSASASQPVQSSLLVGALEQPVQTASQRVSSAQPVLSSYQSGLYSQNVGFDSSAGTGSGGSFYTSRFSPPNSISKPVPSSYQQVTSSQPVQSSYPSGTSGIGLASSDSRAYSSSGSSYPSSRNPRTSISKPVESPFQQLALAQPAQSNYPPEAASQNIRMDSSLTDVEESVLRNDYSSEDATSGLNYSPFTSISTPSQSTYRQVTAAQPVQSRYQDVPFPQTSYGASLSGVTSTGSRSVYTPSDSVALPAQDMALRPGLTPVSAQGFRSPYSYAQAVSSLDDSEPSAGSPRLTWTQKTLE